MLLQHYSILPWVYSDPMIFTGRKFFFLISRSISDCLKYLYVYVESTSLVFFFKNKIFEHTARKKNWKTFSFDIRDRSLNVKSLQFLRLTSHNGVRKDVNG